MFILPICVCVSVSYLWKIFLFGFQCTLTLRINLALRGSTEGSTARASTNFSDFSQTLLQAQRTVCKAGYSNSK